MSSDLSPNEPAARAPRPRSPAEVARLGDAIYEDSIRARLKREHHGAKVSALPFRAGEQVEVIVLPAPRQIITPAKHPLHGSILRYDRPTDPVAEDDWEANR